MKKILFLISFILLSNVATADEILINNLNVNYLQQPYYLSSNSYSHDDIFQGIVSSSVINGEAIKLTEDMGTISSIKIILKRKIYSVLPDNNATITLRVYKSLDETSGSSKYLWDSVVLNPSSETTQSYLFSFDSDINIYNEQGEYTVKWLWIELQENYSDIDNMNPVLYGFYNHISDNKYSYSDNYQYDGGTWTTIESHYSNPWYNDIAFALYGRWHYPTTPLPTPTQTSDNPDNPPCFDCNGTIPGPDAEGNTSWNPDFNDTSIPCPECIGNESINPYDTITKDSWSEITLKGLGYCNTLGCTLDDIIALLYDLSFIGVYGSFVVVFFKLYRKKVKI